MGGQFADLGLHRHHCSTEPLRLIGRSMTAWPNVYRRAHVGTRTTFFSSNGATRPQQLHAVIVCRSDHDDCGTRNRRSGNSEYFRKIHGIRWSKETVHRWCRPQSIRSVNPFVERIPVVQVDPGDCPAPLGEKFSAKRAHEATRASLKIVSQGAFDQACKGLPLLGSTHFGRADQPASSSASSFSPIASTPSPLG